MLLSENSFLLHTQYGAVRLITGVLYIYIEINKNLKFKKGVGIAIKSKETSSKLAI